MGQCGPIDQFYIISNSWGKEKSGETKNPEMGNVTPETTQLPEEIDFRENLGWKYSAPWGPPN